MQAGRRGRFPVRVMAAARIPRKSCGVPLCCDVALALTLLRPPDLQALAGSAINGPGWSAGDTRKLLQIIELEMVAGAAFEPAIHAIGPFRVVG